MKITQCKSFSIYARFTSGGLVFFMDNGHLCMQIGNDEDAQYALTPQETHRLLNLLFDYRNDIYQANVAAKEYVSGRGRKYKSTRSS